MILAIVLVVFGPSRLPGLGESVGKAIRGFKDSSKENDKGVDQSTDDDRENNK